MAVGAPTRRQQSYLTEYDKQMAQYLRQMSGSIGPQDIASESYGGKFPVGTMTAKILSGVLAGGADRRAINRVEQSKRAALELMKKPPTEITEDTAVGDAIYNKETDSYSTISAAPVVAGVERQTRDEFKRNELAKQYANLGPEAITRLQKSGVTIPQVLRQEYIPLNEREVLKPRESTAGMTIAGSAENPNWVERQLGDVAGETINNRAELAQLAGYDALQFSEYERDKKLAEMPQRKMIEVFDKQNNRIQITTIFNPLTGQTTSFDKLNNPVDISQYTSKKYDLAGDDYQIIDADGTVSIENLTKSEVANYKKAGKSVTEFYPNQTFDAIANNIIERNINENFGYDINGNLINVDNGQILLEYFEGNRATQFNRSKQSIDTITDKTIISDGDETVEVDDTVTTTKIEPFVITEEMQTEITNFNTSEPILKLENQLLKKENQLSNTTVGSSIYKIRSKEKEDLVSKIETKRTNLATLKKDYKTDVNYLSTFSNDVYMYERDINQIKVLLKAIEGGKPLDDTKLAMLMKGGAWIPGSPASQIKELLVSLGGRISFEALATMRKNSKTGGAVGQLSDSEREVLAMTQGVIKFEQIRTTLNSLDDLLKRLKKDKARFINNHNDMFNTKFEEDF